MANDTSTALSLTLFNPYLIYTNQLERTEYLNAIKQSSKFSQLLAQLNAAYQSDANTALDYDINPTIYQFTAQLMKEIMEKKAEEEAKKVKEEVEEEEEEEEEEEDEFDEFDEEGEESLEMEA